MADPDWQALLDEAILAKHAILTQKRIVTVGYGERRLQYSETNISDLDAWITFLQGKVNPLTNARKPFGTVWEFGR